MDILDMTFIREHEIGNGRVWSTISQGPSVMVPASDIERMSEQELGAALKTLLDDAQITGLHEWIEFWQDRTLQGAAYGDPKRRYIALCISIGGLDEDSQKQVSNIRDGLSQLQKYRHLDTELDKEYARLCELLDGAYQYVRGKKPTAYQSRAKTVIMQLRNGCELCGLLEGNHTEECARIRKTTA